MTNQKLFISRITQFSEDEISTVLNAVTLMLESKELTPMPNGPYCGSHVVIRYGHKCKKQRYNFYRGVASKYINKYNALFSTTYRNAENMIRRLMDTVLTVTGINHYHSNKDVKETGVLTI